MAEESSHQLHKEPTQHQRGRTTASLAWTEYMVNFWGKKISIGFKNVI